MVQLREVTGLERFCMYSKYREQDLKTHRFYREVFRIQRVRFIERVHCIRHKLILTIKTQRAFCSSQETDAFARNIAYSDMVGDRQRGFSIDCN